MEKKLKELVDATERNMKYCRWVRSQTVENYFKELEEEIRELKTAIKSKNKKDVEEELGDIFWDLFMLAKILEKEKSISRKKVICEVIKKFRRRKPYIFESREVSIEEAHKLWHDAKNKEKKLKIKKKNKN